MQSTHHTPIGVIVLTFMIIIGTAFLIKDDATDLNKTLNTTDVATSSQQTQPVPYKCGLTITSPAPGSRVSFPLGVSGKIDNMAATDGCTWNMFEGMAGTVSVSDSSGVHATVGLAVAGDWTGNVPVTFSGVLNPPTTFTSGTILTLTFTEEDPSGQSLGSSFSYQVIAQ